MEFMSFSLLYISRVDSASGAAEEFFRQIDVLEPIVFFDRQFEFRLAPIEKRIDSKVLRKWHVVIIAIVHNFLPVYVVLRIVPFVNAGFLFDCGYNFHTLVAFKFLF